MGEVQTREDNVFKVCRASDAPHVMNRGVSIGVHAVLCKSIAIQRPVRSAAVAHGWRAMRVFLPDSVNEHMLHARLMRT